VIKTRRSGRLIAAAAAMSLVIAACGGDDDTASDEPAAAEAPADEPADAPAEEPADEPAAEPADEPSSAEAAGTGVEGGTLIWAHEQEPPDLHLDDPENNLSITSWIRSALIEGFYGISGGNDYYPELLDGEAVPTTNDDGSVTITYTLRSGAMWSDGTPLTAADAKFTFDAVMAKDDAGEYIYLAGDRSSLEQITAVEVVSDTEITMTWAGFNAGWKDVNERDLPGTHLLG
jgi:peptide/nickel transport system substrate-binding protein